MSNKKRRVKGPKPKRKEKISKLSFLEIVKINIAKLYSKEQAESFVSNKNLMGCETYNDNVQRGLINRVIINKLLVFRAHHKVRVTDVIYCLPPDGDNESWMTVFKTVILPFLKDNKIEL